MQFNQPIQTDWSIVQHIRESFTKLVLPCPARAVMRGNGKGNNQQYFLREEHGDWHC
jgi:hypothetical protein